MSIYHSVNCDKKTVQGFKEEVRAWFQANNLPFQKITALTGFDGEVRVYRGTESTRLSRRRVLQHDEGGYFRAKTYITKKDYYPFYREEWADDTDPKSYMHNAIIEFFKN